MSVQNFSSLAGLKVAEKFDLIYFFGWLGGWPVGLVGVWPGWWVSGKSGIKANLSLSLS